MKWLPCTLSVVLILSSPAISATWIATGDATDGTSLFIDKDTIKRTGNNVAFWVRFDNSTIRNIKDRTKTYQQNKFIADCDAQTIRQVYTSTYSSAGDILNTQNFPYAASQPWIPDSVGETLAKIVCKATDQSGQ